MSRKLIAVVVSSAFLMTSIAASAADPQTPAPAPQTAGTTTATTAKNEPPLPPGRARDIKKAQGLGDDDLGPGVIIASIAVATGILVWLMFKGDDDSSSSTGTN
jgi:hypothetical protein